MDLNALGWNTFFQQSFLAYEKFSYLPARVAREHREQYLIYCEKGEFHARVSGRFLHLAQSRADFPCVGDWVAIETRDHNSPATIHAVLPRKSSFSRKAVLAGGPTYGPGRSEEQVLAANIDIVFLVCGLDADFNPRRIERYLASVWDGGARPVIILNKADLCSEVEHCLAEISDIAFGIPVHAVSASTETGMEPLAAYLTAGSTVAFLGSSGVGKSTLINALLGENRQATGSVREADGRGRHTTTYRELIFLSGGAMVIDTPGLRRFQSWAETEIIEKTFEDIESLAAQCRFRDCRHQDEPGCAVRQAIETGVMDMARFDNYRKLMKEQKYLEERKDDASRRQTQRAFDKKIHKILKEREQMKRKGLL